MSRQRSVTALLYATIFVNSACSDTSFTGQSAKNQKEPPVVVQDPPPPLPPPGPVPPEPLISPLEKEEVHEFTQVSGNTVVRERVQGSPGVLVEAGFEQGTLGALDILVVVDNSASMTEEQANLAPKLSALLSRVERADWRVAVTTTDPNDPCLLAVIGKGDPNGASLFGQVVLGAGTGGASLERPFYRIAEALNCTTNGSVGDIGGGLSWLRKGSTLAVLIVSDEDNCHSDQTNGYRCQTEDRDPQFLLAALQAVRALKTEARVYGIVSQPSSPCTTALKTATLITDAVMASGGITGDICAGDYTDILNEISSHVAQILTVDFVLEKAPSPGTMAVTVNGSNWAQYQVQGQKVVFTDPPPFGSMVQVAYRYGVEGVYDDQLSLEEVPEEKSLSITIEDQPLSPDQFTFDPQTKKVKLRDIPPEGAVVRARYTELKNLGKTFFVGPGPLAPDSLSVTVDAKPVPAATYDSGAGIVTLDSVPQPGAKIVIKLKRKT